MPTTAGLGVTVLLFYRYSDWKFATIALCSYFFLVI